MSDNANSTVRDLSRDQWKSGIAAWLGWMFDGLDMHLYTLVALPFVAELLRVSTKDPAAGHYSSWIQASFLVGWALGGAILGRVGDRLGRTRTLMLTILTYAMFTGLSFFAQSWWHLLIFRFLAALGIGGEWAVGASLLSETWPRRLQPWVAAVLQTSGNCGVLLASLAYFLIARAEAPNRAVFLVGILPALIVFCYNIGRIVAAGGTVFFGLFSKVGDHRLAILYAGLLFLPAALVAYFLPEDRGPIA